MGDNINIDWSQVPTPDYVGNYVNAFRVGQGLAREGMQDSALSSYGTDPQGSVAALMRVNPNLALQLQANTQAQQDRAARASSATALAGGDYAGAESALAPTGDYDAIRQLNGDQKAAAAQQAEKLAAVLHGLLQYPPEQRLGIAQHIAQRAGIDPSQITADDVTDQGIAGRMAQTMSIQQMLKSDEPIRVGKGDSLFYPHGGASVQGAATAPAVAPTPATPSDLDSMARAIYTEARGEPAQGQAAVGHVILNRAKASGQPVAAIVHAPGQFEGMTSSAANVSASDPGYQRALQVAQAVLSGQVPDPTGGADHFLNPQLQTNLGRQIPAWAQGPGQRIGNHVFFK
ncbi:MAG: cell wall hydrolase, partial [Candidatus Dormibacteria bacterium]